MDHATVACFSQDQFNMLLSTGLTAYQLFKLVMATLLSVFVPQRCEADPKSSNPDLQVVHDCTIEENFEELTNFNVFVTTWNFITMFFALIHYFCVYRRESTMNQFLDEDPTVTDDNLVRKSKAGDQCVMDLYPAIYNVIRQKNISVAISGGITLLFSLVNVIVSGILVFRDYYSGFRTVTVRLSSCLTTVSHPASPSRVL